MVWKQARTLKPPASSLARANEYRAEDLDGVYQRVASELQTLYSVSYNPADKNYDGKWRNVGVKVKQGAAMARTKRGFYAR